MDERMLVVASYAGRLWDAARLLDADYSGADPKVPWAELEERYKVEFMHRTDHLIAPMLEAYAATGSDE